MSYPHIADKCKIISIETAKPVLTLEMIRQNIAKMAYLAIHADDNDVEAIAYAVLNMAEDMAHNYLHGESDNEGYDPNRPNSSNPNG